MYVCCLSIPDFNLLKLPSFYIKVDDLLPILENRVTKHSTIVIDARL